MKKKLPSINKPKYKLISSNTLVFISGAPLSGKSTIAPLVVSSIKGCTLQPMDIIRLLAQEVENQKPENERSPFVNYGSCDSYVALRDGSYSPESLIEGFNAYSEAVSSLLTKIIPKLEAQGVRDLLFEGVQLTPKIIRPYLHGNNKLIVITSNESQLASNRGKIFGKNQELLDRYSTDKLMLIQKEILRQANEISKHKVLRVENVGEYTDCVVEIIQFLLDEKVITSR
jgi:2-phosphoglycerate kinase